MDWDLNDNNKMNVNFDVHTSLFYHPSIFALLGVRLSALRSHNNRSATQTLRPTRIESHSIHVIWCHVEMQQCDFAVCAQQVSECMSASAFKTILKVFFRICFCSIRCCLFVYNICCCFCCYSFFFILFLSSSVHGDIHIRSSNVTEWNKLSA